MWRDDRKPNNHRMNAVTRRRSLTLLVLALPVAAISWAVTHEELFREVHDYCLDRSRKRNSAPLVSSSTSSPVNTASATTWPPVCSLQPASGFFSTIGAATRRVACPCLDRQSLHQPLRSTASGHPKRAARDWPEGGRQRARRRHEDGARSGSRPRPANPDPSIRGLTRITAGGRLHVV